MSPTSSPPAPGDTRAAHLRGPLPFAFPRLGAPIPTLDPPPITQLARRFRLVARLLLAFLSAHLADARAQASPAPSLDPAQVFEAANNAFEKRQYTDAIRGYQSLVDQGRVNSTLLFNLGNAWFKSGRPGRAILFYRRALILAPRDPDIASNLRFARDSAGTAFAEGLLQRSLARLTLNEWLALAAAFGWITFLLLALSNLPRAPATSLRRTACASAVLLVITSSILANRWRAERRLDQAVVVEPGLTPALYGPLAESDEAFQLREGTEVIVLDRKNDWLQVRDSSGRTGWLRQNQVESVRSPSVP